MTQVVIPLVLLSGSELTSAASAPGSPAKVKQNGNLQTQQATGQFDIKIRVSRKFNTLEKVNPPW